MRQRNDGIDLLRIVSMMMVVALHLLWRGGALRLQEASSPAYGVGWALEIACFGAVNCYGLISGYVGVHARFRLSKLLEMWFQVVVTFIGVRSAMHLLMPEEIALWTWKEGLHPLNNQYYWYVQAYFVLSLFGPALNAALRAMRRREALVMLGGMMILLSVLDNFYFKGNVFGLANGYSGLWLMALYMAGGYIRLYGDRDRLVALLEKYGLYVYLGCMLAMFMNLVGLPAMQGSLTLLDVDSSLTYTYPLIVVGAAALLAWFSRLRLGKAAHRVIAGLTPAVFGVFLIHTQTDIWRFVLKDCCAALAGLSAPLFVLALLGAVAGVYLLCTALEYARILLFRLLRVRKLCALLLGWADRWAERED